MFSLRTLTLVAGGTVGGALLVSMTAAPSAHRPASPASTVGERAAHVGASEADLPVSPSGDADAGTAFVVADAAPDRVEGMLVSRQTVRVEKPWFEAEPEAEPFARLLEPLPVAPPVDYAAVEELRRSDPRFARLTFDLRDGRVVIAGRAEPAVAWELARKVAPLVGDRDVVVSLVKR